jgi:hypothetical protein
MAGKPVTGGAEGAAGAAVSQSVSTAAGGNKPAQKNTGADSAAETPKELETQAQPPKNDTPKDDSTAPPKSQKAAYSAPGPEELSKKFKTWN